MTDLRPVSTAAVGPLRPSAATFSRQRLRHRHILSRAALFIAGATSAVPLGGVTATGLSVLCLLLLPGYLLVEHRGTEFVPVLLAALGWLSYLTSCVINGVDPLSPNALAPAAFALYLIGLTVLVGRSVPAISTVLAGIAAGTVLFHLFRGIELTRTGSFLDLWKYGIAQSVTILVLFALVESGARRKVLPIALLVLGMGSLVLNFRSHALVCIVAAAIVATSRSLPPRIGRVGQYAVVFGSTALFAVLMPIAARSGLFGAALREKVLQQDASHLPILFAGRTEPPLSITAILERPLLGWGDAQHLTPALYTRAEHLAIDLGYAPTAPFDTYWRIPGDYSALHSIILGSWAEGGILAALLPLWLLGACLLLIWNNPGFGRWSPLVVVVAVQGIWDLAYSPWTYNLIPVYACIALLFAVRHVAAPVPADSGPGARPGSPAPLSGSEPDPDPDYEAKCDPSGTDDSPAVSVVIPTVGRPTLTRAVRSVLEQSRPAIEIIVVADTDAPVPVPADDRITVLRPGTPGGSARCRQAWIDAAGGSVIALLDDDDEWHPDKLRRQLEAVKHLAGEQWVVSSRVAVAGPGDRRRIWPRRLIRPGQPVVEYLFRFTDWRFGGAVLQSSTLCFPTSLARQIRWDDDPDTIQDEPGWLIRAQRTLPGIRILQLPDVLGTYHVSAESVSRTSRDRTVEYLAWGLDNLGSESARLRGDYLCTSPVSAAVSARSLRGVRRAVTTAIREGRPGPKALTYAAAGAVRIVVRKLCDRWLR